MKYIVIVVDSIPIGLAHELTIDNVRIGYCTIGQIVHGWHFNGVRITHIVDRTTKRIPEGMTQEYVDKWWTYLREGAGSRAEFVNEQRR
mgnify:CR=1 FL=1